MQRVGDVLSASIWWAGKKLRRRWKLAKQPDSAVLSAMKPGAKPSELPQTVPAAWCIMVSPFPPMAPLKDGPPATDTLGFRWSAVNNLFSTTSEIAAEEWRASRAADEDNAERERRQFVWCLPVIPTKWTDAELETHELACRVASVPRGVVPQNTESLTVAMDLGKYLNHWIVVAWSPGPFGHVVDYGRIEVAN